MKRVVIRVLTVFITLFALSLLTFALSYNSMGNSSSLLLSEEAGSEVIGEYESMRGSESFASGYFSFLKGFFTFDLGLSSDGYPISSQIMHSLPITLTLSFISVSLSLVFSLLWALLSAARGSKYSALEGFSMVVSSLPSFAISLILVLLFSFLVPLFPSSGYVSIKEGVGGYISHLVLPAISLSLMHSALMLRVFRNSFSIRLKSLYRDVLKSEGAKGVRLVYYVSFKESLPLIFSITADSFASSFSGSAVIEGIFALPGIGSLIVSAALSRDYRLLSSAVLTVALLSSLFYVLSEVFSYMADPRQRRGHES